MARVAEDVRERPVDPPLLAHPAQPRVQAPVLGVVHRRVDAPVADDAVGLGHAAEQRVGLRPRVLHAHGVPPLVARALQVGHVRRRGVFEVEVVLREHARVDEPAAVRERPAGAESSRHAERDFRGYVELEVDVLLAGAELRVAVGPELAGRPHAEAEGPGLVGLPGHAEHALDAEAVDREAERHVFPARLGDRARVTQVRAPVERHEFRADPERVADAIGRCDRQPHRAVLREEAVVHTDLRPGPVVEARAGGSHRADAERPAVVPRDDQVHVEERHQHFVLGVIAEVGGDDAAAVSGPDAGPHRALGEAREAGGIAEVGAQRREWLGDVGSGRRAVGRTRRAGQKP